MEVRLDSFSVPSKLAVIGPLFIPGLDGCGLFAGDVSICDRQLCNRPVSTPSRCR